MSSIKHHVTGLQYWRSLEQLAQTPEVQAFMDKEFPGYDADTISTTSRRGFMKLMGAAMALAGVTLTGCRRWPREELEPYASNPREHVPGIPEQYASTWELNGVGHPLLITSFDGRPIKVDGNPSHPASWVVKGKYGSADAFAQATILEMYDPDRSRFVIDRRQGLEQQRHTQWESFLPYASAHFKALRDKAGAGLAVLSEASASPSVMIMRAAFEKIFPHAKWYEYEPISLDNEREGTRLAFGEALRPVLKLDQADVVVSLDNDFLLTHPNHTQHANQWVSKRRSADRDKTMSRVYIAESLFSVTGTVADVRLGVAPQQILFLVRALAEALKTPGLEAGSADKSQKLSADEQKFIEQAAHDLQAAKGSALVTVGHAAPPEAHAIAFAINAGLGAIGKTIVFLPEAATKQSKDRPPHVKAISELVSALNGGSVATLLLLGGNPSYDAPADLNFPAALAKAPTSIHLSLYDNETSRGCKWHLPRAHYLECWGDSRTWDGIPTLQQPIIEPLFGGKSVIELLALLTDMRVNGKVPGGDQIVRMTWAGLLGQMEGFEKSTEAFDKAFRATLERGFLEKAASKPVEAQLKLAALPAAPAAGPSGYTLRFMPDSHTYDGRFANNGWLEETPDPLTKLMWDNAALISVKDALALGVDTGDMLQISIPGAGQAMKIPALLLPGQPLGVIGLSLGFGRTEAAGRIGAELGFNIYPWRTSHNLWSVAGAQVKKTGDDYSLITSAEHHILDPLTHRTIERRVGEKFESGMIIREATLAEYKDDPRGVGAPRKIGLQLFQPPVQPDENGMIFAQEPHAWGMSIDLTACIGCNACALACQAENNIPIVGKEQCSNHREMNWIRIDRYFKGDMDDPNPEVVFQPMLCQHCENAPCEQVCPVAATVHDSEGLNTMVYNRCIGTRYCSNNCPYKVRRFNYFDYHAEDPRMGNRWIKAPWPNIPDLQQLDPALVDPVKRMMFNPDVTVRMRGVMEKCTFCVQRIHGAVIAKRREGTGPEHDVKDGDIITACQQACPTQAIVFGNLKDRQSEVVKLQQSPRAFDVLQAELNTLPRIRYLAKLRNPGDYGIET